MAVDRGRRQSLVITPTTNLGGLLDVVRRTVAVHRHFPDVRALAFFSYDINQELGRLEV